MINRFSSRRTKLDQTFLNQRLQGAQTYDRIAGYFRSSILEVAGEALESITGQIRVICNSDLNVQDVNTAKAANYAMRREWCAAEPEKYSEKAKPRFARLYQFLRSGKMHVKVLPREKFGLVHGKAGVITMATGTKTSFMGSTNETYDAWKLHYELVWEDSSLEAIQWVQEEFDALWHHPLAVNLADFVIEDIGRLSQRSVFPSVEVWREEANPGAPIIETTIDPETNEPYLKPVKVKLYGETDRDSIPLPLYLRDAYAIAEEFCDLLGQRMKGTGFLRTLLLRRVGSTICAGMNTAKSMLGAWEDIEEDDEDAVADDTKSLIPAERDKLEQFLDKLEANQEDDPKYEVVRRLLIEEGWLEEGCIIFSHYFDSIRWLADQLSGNLPKGEAIGIYAGGQKSGVLINGVFTRQERESLKQMVRRGEMRLLLGTDAASEGLNLQRLGTLINLDLPWNPTRLEQRKGRIQRIGQLRDVVYIYNMRYRGSVEDRVHELLSDRLAAIHQLFGQIPDVLEDVWVQVAQGKIEEAKQTINAVPQKHPFEFKYHQVKKVPWESCATVLSASDRRQHLLQGW